MGWKEEIEKSKSTTIIYAKILRRQMNPITDVAKQPLKCVI